MTVSQCPACAAMDEQTQEEILELFGGKARPIILSPEERANLEAHTTISVHRQRPDPQMRRSCKASVIWRKVACRMGRPIFESQ
jgi:hypothetical protein